MSTSRRIALIALAVLTLALGVVAIIISIRLSQTNQAPETSSANTECPKGLICTFDPDPPPAGYNLTCISKSNVDTTTYCCPSGEIIYQGSCSPVSGDVCPAKIADKGCGSNAGCSPGQRACDLSGHITCIADSSCTDPCPGSGACSDPKNNRTCDVIGGTAQSAGSSICSSGAKCCGGGSGPAPVPQPVNTGGGCVSDYCAGTSQCASQGGTSGGQGPRPSGGNCTNNTSMCCIIAKPAPAPAPTPTPPPSTGPSALTQCILAARPDILPFYKSNGWDTSPSNQDAIIANWKTIDPNGYATAAAACNGTASGSLCGGTCTTSTDCRPVSGVTVVCNSHGTCANSACVNSTIAGLACTCGNGGTTATVLPNTAVFDDKTDAILLGFLFVIIGLIFWKSSMLDKALYLFAVPQKRKKYRKNVETLVDSWISK